MCTPLIDLSSIMLQIRQIQQFDQANLRQSDTKALQSLEVKISSTIMPIKQRLSNKLQQAQREMQQAVMMQCRQPPPPPALPIQRVLPHSGHAVDTNPQASSVNNFNHTMSATAVTADLHSSMSSSLGLGRDANPASVLSVATSNVQIANMGGPAPVESKKKRKRQSKKNVKEGGGSISEDRSLNIVDSLSASNSSPNGISGSLSNSVMNCYEEAETNVGENMDNFNPYVDDSDMYLYDLCLGQEDLDLGAIEAKVMFSGDCFDDADVLQESTADASTLVQQSNDEPPSRAGTNKNVVDSHSSSATSDNNANISMRVGSDEYISPRRRRRLNQIVPNPRNPRSVEYQCSCCSSNYPMSVQDNPWWAIYIQECPNCKSNQVPRFDINVTNNAIELDPNIVALYGEGVDDDDDCALDDDDDEDEEEDDVGGNQAEEECFGVEGCLDHDEASKLLVLMCHARTCTGIHVSQKHADVCKSTKFLMLHIRDCNGIDIYGNNCKFPWCMPCKKMLQHLTKCPEPAKCAICNPFTLPESFQQLQALNQHRSKVTDSNSSGVHADTDTTTMPSQACTVVA